MISGKALLLIDIQYDFLEGGALEVNEASQIVPPILSIAGNFSCIIATQDWHPPDHKSFASSHSGKQPYDLIQWKGREEILWPDHCVQKTKGAEIHPDILALNPVLVVKKGADPETDSYSAFFDNHREQKTPLAGWLAEKKITELTIAGLATDFCVKYSVLDALSLGYSVEVFSAGCRGVNRTPGASEQALEEMKIAGAEIR